MQNDCVQIQNEFLVLLTIYEDAKYQKSGIMLNELSDKLAKNGELWLLVGQIKEEKSYEKTLDWILSNLSKEEVLEPRFTPRNFVAGKNFIQGFQDRIQALYEALEIDIEFGEYRLSNAINREAIISEIRSGNIGYTFFHRDEIRNKEYVMLTNEQMNRLIQLTVHFGISI